MQKYLDPVADLFTYTLMPNHFHLLLRIKNENAISTYYVQKKNMPLEDMELLPAFIMQQFSNWLNCYAKAFNKMYDRKGSLFIDYIKRSVVKNESDMASFIFYIHKNAVHHGLCKRIGDWKLDGYNAILGNEPTFLKREELISFFGSIENFIKFHERPVELKQRF